MIYVYLFVFFQFQNEIFDYLAHGSILNRHGINGGDRPYCKAGDSPYDNGDRYVFIYVKFFSLKLDSFLSYI